VEDRRVRADLMKYSRCFVPYLIHF